MKNKNLIKTADTSFKYNQNTVPKKCTINSILAPKNYGSWELQAKLICYEAKGKGYGAFSLTRTALLEGIMLTHISGNLTCGYNYPHWKSLWGCSLDKQTPRGKKDVFTVITDGDDKIVFPANLNFDPGYTGITVPGVNAKRTKNLVYTNFAHPNFFTKHQELRIWFSEDLMDHGAYNNDGKHCVKVYAKFKNM